MVVKLETIAALGADVYPACAKVMGRDQCVAPEGPRRQKLRKTQLPALVEDDSEPETADTFEKPRRHVPHLNTLRRQNSISPHRREKLCRQLVLPSLSEDEEP